MDRKSINYRTRTKYDKVERTEENTRYGKTRVIEISNLVRKRILYNNSSPMDMLVI